MKRLLLIFFVCPVLWGTGTLDAQERRFGWIGDDGSKPVRMMMARDWPVKEPAAKSDLARYAVTAMDQGQIGSCVGNGTALAWDMQHYRATGRHLPLSRLMIYYNARKMEGWENADTGCQIVDAVTSLVKLGACKEVLWPYHVARFRQQPANDLYVEALNHRVIRSYKVDNTDGRSIRLALTNRWPVVFGALVYPAIQDLTRRNSVLPMPARGQRYIGGHCMVIIGHDDAKRLYRVQNSWGREWGDRGRCWIPFEYIHRGDITEDCWTLEEVMR